MKGLAEKKILRRFWIVIPLLLIISFAVVTVSYSLQLGARRIRPITAVVRYPLPSVPEPVLMGNALKVLVNATPNAGSWNARLTCKFGSRPLTMINSSYVEGKGWVLFFRVPDDLYPTLYALNVVFSQEGELINYTQPRSVWVLQEWPKRLRIGHITDTHLPYGADVLARSVYELNLLRPDMIILTGDVVDVETLASAWIYLQRIMDWLEVPSYILPGNHDYAGANSTNYQRFCGTLHYAAEIGSFLLIALDCTNAGYVVKSQLQWAESVLRKHPNKVKIVGLHYPLFSRGDGGNITGSWKEINQLEKYMYSSWAEHPDEAREFLRLVEEYDIRLILAGHIHRDVIYVYNNKHHFVTTSTAGGSLPPGFYYCSRLIEIDTNGNVYYDAYAQKKFFNPPNSIPTGYVTYYYAPANDGTENAVSAVIENEQERELINVRLEFFVSPEHPVEDYKFYPTTPTRYEVLTTESGHYFIAFANVSRGVHTLTLAATEDHVKPRIEVTPLEEIREGTPITLAITATDDEWGVRGILVEYSTDGGENWSSANVSLSLQVDKNEYKTEYRSVKYTATIPGQASGTELLVKVEAWDFANNTETYQKSYMIGAPSPPPSPPPPPTYTLLVNSSPITEVPVTIDGASHTTPYSAALTEGSHTITVPPTVTIAQTTYNFVRWEDGSTNPKRTINLTKDMTLTAYYEEVPPPSPSPSPPPSPSPTPSPPPPSPALPMWQVMAAIAVIVIVVAGVIIALKIRRKP